MKAGDGAQGSASRLLASDNCFYLKGPLEGAANPEMPLLFVALVERAGEIEVAATKIIRNRAGGYGALLPEGKYELLVFADLNHDGYFDENEVVGCISGREKFEISPASSFDGFFVPGPSIRVNLSDPQRLGTAIHISAAEHHEIFNSLDDEFFDPRYGIIGLYDPLKFLAHTRGLLFGLEDFDPEKTTVLFVHGAAGTPRDWKFFAEELDRQRYQPWFFYYPTGMPLAKLGLLLANMVRSLDYGSAEPIARLVIVGHSMGGLVSWAAINDLCVGGVPQYLKQYISLSTPYGGIEELKLGKGHLPGLIPSWRDLVPESPFLSTLYSRDFPAEVPVHLFFSFRNDSTLKIGQNSDGRITLKSQLHPRVQGKAARIHGFDATHTGVLSSPEAAALFKDLLGDGGSLERVAAKGGGTREE